MGKKIALYFCVDQTIWLENEIIHGYSVIKDAQTYTFVWLVIFEGSLMFKVPFHPSLNYFWEKNVFR